MEQLYLAYIDASNDYDINQLLLISCYILDFLCIHPFSDGNGRISRLLSLLILYKNDYEIVQNKKISKKERIWLTIESSHKPLSKVDIHNVWPDISVNTIVEELNALVKSNKIHKLGKFKDAQYLKVSKIG